ncbi:MAG: iron-containing redox enzyme family protein [Nitrospirales bacterium]|nr:iron-containing redox enzyme family protein [Nitrospira sp.]MDR4502825.1 iron-containing redox enzyme family protein [Nitrospirales bacterium]
MRTLSPDQFREKLFDVLRRKRHWADSYFNGNTITMEHLHRLYHQEYVVYIRDFAVLLARILGKNPPWEVRRRLATTIYEEETGGLSFHQPHQELFLQMMIGLGFDRSGFRDVTLLSSSRTYREWLDHLCQEDDWLVGATVLTVFVEGTSMDPEDVMYPKGPKSSAEIEDIIMKHPLVQYQGVSPKYMDYIRVQQIVEPVNRRAIYDMIIHHAIEADQQQSVLQQMEETLQQWSRYQDGIARACGLRQ